LWRRARIDWMKAGKGSSSETRSNDICDACFIRRFIVMSCLACFEMSSISYRVSKEAAEKLGYKIRETALQMYPIINGDILHMIVLDSQVVRSQEIDPEHESNE
jgi:hypothetical protein